MSRPTDAADEPHPAVVDQHPTSEEFLGEVLEHLSRTPRQLPCKYFYDERGSILFDRICECDEYYPTRTELGILRDNAAHIAAHIGPRAEIIEPGSGSSLKTQSLLEALDDPAVYIPVEISREHLEAAAERVRARFPDLEVRPVCADFTAGHDVPPSDADTGRRVFYFPGSTIGNFEPHARRALLGNFAHVAGPGGTLLIGIDLEKDERVLHAAYNDRDGITAAFNLNLLERINRELDADFNTAAFRHTAIYNHERARVEMHLLSERDQTAHIGTRPFRFAKGETIHTENSHKFRIDRFAAEAGEAGFELEAGWTDSRSYFAVLLFRLA